MDANATLDLSDTSGVTLTVRGDNDTQISGAISGAGGSLEKLGSGTLTLEGSDANVYDGNTTVTAGTLALDKTAGVNAVAGDLIVNGGTLLLNESDQIADTSDLALGGGTFATNGNDEALATLTLNTSSTIDLGSGSSVLNFDDSSSVSWVSGQSLFITNWSGSATDQVFFGNSGTGLNGSQITQIVFVNPAGYGTGNFTAEILATGEIVPVPEPSTWIMGGLGLIGILAHFGFSISRKRSIEHQD